MNRRNGVGLIKKSYKLNLFPDLQVVFFGAGSQAVIDLDLNVALLLKFVIVFKRVHT